MRRGVNTDMIGGAILLILGLGLIWHTYSGYSFGTMRRMGPGFFPLVLSITLAGIGFLIFVSGVVKARNAQSEVRRSIDLSGAGFILGGIVAFGMMLPVLGLVVSGFATAIVVLIPDRRFTLLAKVATAATLALLTYAIFILGLRMNLPVWPAL